VTNETMTHDIPISKTILLIEDDEAVRDSVRMGLVQFGFQVLETSNGDDAAILCRAYEGKIDAAVIDMVMPRMWGHEIAAQLREISSRIKVVYISGHSEEFMLGCGVLKAEDVFFPKPFYPSELADKIYEMLGVPNPLMGSCPVADPAIRSQESTNMRGPTAATPADRPTGSGT
jgi:DNA-binding response OmpR family regulator